MFCKNCGKEIKNESKFCPYCGGKLHKDERKQQFAESEIIQRMKSYTKRKEFWIVIVILIVVSIVGNLGGKRNTDKVVQKIQSFTRMEKTDDSYIFSSDSWSLKYVESNEFVEFSDNAVYKCFVNCFDTYDLGNEGTFTYDLSENEIRIYFNCEIPEGKITVVNYDISSDKFTLMINGQRYEPTDIFVEFVNDCGLADIMKNDIETFKNELEDNDLSIEKITDLKYKDLVKSIH